MRSDISRFWEGTDEKFAKPMPIPSRPPGEKWALFLGPYLCRTCQTAGWLDSVPGLMEMRGEAEMSPV